MREIELSLLPKIAAQSSTIARPTFVTDIEPKQSGQVTPPPTQPPANQPPASFPATPLTGDAQITLESASSRFSTGRNFIIQLRVNTKGEKVKSYTAVISFDPQKLEIIDKNTSISGVQVEYNGSFTLTENAANNTQGSVRLRAENTTATSFNQLVGALTFRAKTTGQTTISVNKTSSSVVDTASVNLLDSVNSLTINVTQTGDDSEVLTPTTPLPIGGLNELPKSDLPFSGILFLGVGVIFVYLGLLGRRIAGKKTPSS